MPPTDPSYTRIVTANSDNYLDRSHGRVHLLEGDLYYSPNSQRDVQLPRLYDDIPFRDCLKHNVSEFHQPLWWHPAYPYLAFLPLQPVFAGVPFQELFHLPSYLERSRAGFTIDPQFILGWARIEQDIKEAVFKLLRHERAPAITWLLRTALCSATVFRRVRDLRAHFEHSRYWFCLWMGGLSYAIAVSMSLCGEDFHEGMPHWFSFLAEQGWSQIWLSGIRSSLVATFNFSIARVGVFVQLLQPQRDQLSIDWLCKFSVPVWYPWGGRETRASLNETHLARFAPLPHQLQGPTTFLTKNPSSDPQPNAEPQTQAFDCAASSVVILSWKAFFEKRREQNERIKARETPKQRQSRESREKNPPTRRTKVFMWTHIEGGGYRRESFYQAENGSHLDDYGKNQKRYDAFSNEWDCCYEFGESSPEEMEDDSDDEYPMMPASAAAAEQSLGPGLDLDNDDYPMTPPSAEAGPDEHSDTVQKRPFSVVGPAEMPFDWEEFETSQLLYEFYGFVCPIPLPSHLPPIDTKRRTLISTIVGLRRNNIDFFESAIANFALEFLERLNASQAPKNTHWDIASGNRMSIEGSEMFRRMCVIKHLGKELYVFDFKERATVPWMVGVPNIVDAFYVCRLDHTGGSRLSDVEVARELLNHGIQFCTLLRVKSLLRSIAPPIVVPVRLPGYEFTRDDYYAYEQQRAALLSDPRIARSALLRGGIVWRLAVATLSFDDVLEGPTTIATLQRRGTIIKTSDDSVDLCDDGLSQLELDIICGLHHCYTEQGNTASKSWWPTDSTWQKHAQHSRWTEKTDHFFTTRLENLRAGKAVPLNFEQWKQQVRGSSSTRRINSFVTSAYENFVKAYLQ